MLNDKAGCPFESQNSAKVGLSSRSTSLPAILQENWSPSGASGQHISTTHKYLNVRRPQTLKQSHKVQEPAAPRPQATLLHFASLKKPQSPKPESVQVQSRVNPQPQNPPCPPGPINKAQLGSNLLHVAVRDFRLVNDLWHLRNSRRL